jgi:Kef-type K+ transport system membrane component KefB
VRNGVEPLAAAVLLPLFFAATGLRTEIGLLGTAADWAVCALVIAVAVAGKLGGSSLAARWSGLAWRDALAIGALMNTRGLMELVVLNIGYELGILSPALYTMMVVMALATTCMAGPMLTMIGTSSSMKEPMVSGQ